MAIKRQRDILAVGVEMTAAERGTGRKTGKYVISKWEMRQNAILI